MKRFLVAIAVYLSCFFSVSTRAVDIEIQVQDMDGEDVQYAVVAIRPIDPSVTLESQYADAVIEQQGMMFYPFVLPVKTGTVVRFPNRDVIRHHVYSFSKPKSFELKLYGQDETQEVPFGMQGVVALGCNIHDNMLAYVYISDAPIALTTGSNGIAVAKALPIGSYEVTLWHPDMKQMSEQSVQRLSVTNSMAKPVWSLVMKKTRRVQLPPEENVYN